LALELQSQPILTAYRNGDCFLQTFGTGDKNTKIARSLSGRAGIEETTLSAFNGIRDPSTLSFQSGYTSGDTDFGYIKQQYVS